MKIISILTTALILVSCKAKTTEEIVKDNIKLYQAKTMDDFNSYEPVDFGKIDSAYLSFFKSQRYTQLSNLIDIAIQRGEVSIQYAKTIKGYDNGNYIKALNHSRQIGHEVDSLNDLLNVEGMAFKTQFAGYKVLHTFRGKNKNGATELMKIYFIMDSAHKVISTEKVNGDN